MRFLTQIWKVLRDSRSAVLNGLGYNLGKAVFPEIHAFNSLDSYKGGRAWGAVQFLMMY